MQEQIFSFQGANNQAIHVYKWLPEDTAVRKGIVQIAHGMAEEGARYKRLARYLTDRGYGVYCNDHRGHGKTAGKVAELGYLGDHKGFEMLVEDMARLTAIIREEQSSLPICLLGHSMGSFATQRYMMQYGDRIDAVILSGSNGSRGPSLYAGLVVAKLQGMVQGRKKQSKLLDKLIFGNYNTKFKPIRTPFDWLSRDTQEVDAYMANPYCGTLFTIGFFEDFMENLIYIQKKKHQADVPKRLPVYIFSGDKDPVGNYGKGVIKLHDAYCQMGLKDVSYKLYPEGRHEMLNEINRDEVMTAIGSWLESHLTND